MGEELNRPRRVLFAATILTGSFLLFLIQPMVARMALPRLGGAPNVWNSAMLAYQALLLAGYFYAHRLSRLPLRRQVMIHLALLACAALTLPVTLAELPPPPPGREVLWVPALLALTIGPVFLLVSAQAPLMQRWFSLSPGADQPWALYAASNLGSFAGLLAYPLLAEPLLSLRAQSLAWAAGYGVLFVLVGLAAHSRWNLAGPAPSAESNALQPVPARRILLWLALAAVPSGLMLSTTTHLTTDLFAMPLLWAIPLGLYLLSFVPAFAERRGAARVIAALAWPAVLLAGGLAMVSHSNGGLTGALVSVGLLFLICVALHTRLYDLRPEAGQLTFFYLIMSLGGVLGGAFTALVAPLAFDWIWEHPLLVLVAAMLLPRPQKLDWRQLPDIDPTLARVATALLLVVGGVLLWLLYSADQADPTTSPHWLLALGVMGIGLLLIHSRWAIGGVLLATMLAQGGLDTLQASRDHLRTRSYFGVYTVRDYPSQHLRSLAHGTTLHGEQSTDAQLARLPLTYYGPGSGAGIAFANAPRLFGPAPRIGVVGLGTGTLACYNQPGEDWRFFEIDPAVLALSRNGTFTYIARCAPRAQVVIGDARLKIARLAPGSLDLLAIDAFSSDAIPLHLLTGEAVGIYERALSPKGVLLIHISNRFIELEPVLAAIARDQGLHAALRDDIPGGTEELLFTPSSWVAITRDPAQLAALERAAPAMPWRPLKPAALRAWSDDHASILPYIRWRNFMGRS